VDARTIYWEMEYGTTTCNLKTGGSTITPVTDDDGDPLETLGLNRKTPSNYSPRCQYNNSFCFPISPNDREFMDIHRMKYIKRKGDKEVDPKVLKKYWASVQELSSV
jgi:hypothetical protein